MLDTYKSCKEAVKGGSKADCAKGIGKLADSVGGKKLKDKLAKTPLGSKASRFAQKNKPKLDKVKANIDKLNGLKDTIMPAGLEQDSGQDNLSPASSEDSGQDSSRTTSSGTKNRSKKSAASSDTADSGTDTASGSQSKSGSRGKRSSKRSGGNSNRGVGSRSKKVSGNKASTSAPDAVEKSFLAHMANLDKVQAKLEAQLKANIESMPGPISSTCTCPDRRSSGFSTSPTAEGTEADGSMCQCVNKGDSLKEIIPAPPSQDGPEGQTNGRWIFCLTGEDCECLAPLKDLSIARYRSLYDQSKNMPHTVNDKMKENKVDADFPLGKSFPGTMFVVSSHIMALSRGLVRRLEGRASALEGPRPRRKLRRGIRKIARVAKKVAKKGAMKGCKKCAMAKKGMVSLIEMIVFLSHSIITFVSHMLESHHICFQNLPLLVP